MQHMQRCMCCRMAAHRRLAAQATDSSDETKSLSPSEIRHISMSRPVSRLWQQTLLISAQQCALDSSIKKHHSLILPYWPVWNICSAHVIMLNDCISTNLMICMFIVQWENVQHILYIFIWISTFTPEQNTLVLPDISVCLHMWLRKGTWYMGVIFYWVFNLIFGGGGSSGCRRLRSGGYLVQAPVSDNVVAGGPLSKVPNL